MLEVLQDYFDTISVFDLIYLIITMLSLIKCYRKGFVLSIVAASKWLLAWFVTLLLFPKLKPYVKNIIDNEYILDVALGVGIFVVVIFIILLINKGIGRAVKYSGLGGLDKFFGLLFGFLRAYVIAVCVFTTINIVYNHNKWPIDLDRSFMFPKVENGSNYLIKEFPDQKQYEDTKDKVQEL